MALMDNGMQINTIMPNYDEESLIGDGTNYGPHRHARVTCMSLGNAYTHPLGYVIVQVQVDGVQGYDEDQIALVILDESKFAEWIPIILGTPTISHVVNVMKEREIDALVMTMGECQGGTSIICV